MKAKILQTSFVALGGAMMVASAVVVGTVAVAQDIPTVTGENYVPTIWIDPDGCEHWAMDDGSEGFMDAHRRPDGSAVCHRKDICGVVFSDQLFVTDKYAINASGRESLTQFFTQSMANGVFGFLVYGHTDSRESDEYNMRLSQNRANAVAAIGQEVGARVVDVRGFGERAPRADNGTAEGMQQNRRVEIYCLR